MGFEPQKIRLIMELRRLGIHDTDTLSAIERVPREAFVLKNFMDKAYDNMALPIDCGQTISQPLIVALMTQALDLKKDQRVLEIGTGSGYQTAILSKLARRVYTIERHADLSQQAEKKLTELKLRNITFKAGDGTKGWPEQAPFERIIVTAAAAGSWPPIELWEQLAIGGIIVIPVTQTERVQMLMKFTRTEQGAVAEEICPVRFVPLLPDEALETAMPARRRMV